MKTNGLNFLVGRLLRPHNSKFLSFYSYRFEPCFVHVQGFAPLFPPLFFSFTRFLFSAQEREFTWVRRVGQQLLSVGKSTTLHPFAWREERVFSFLPFRLRNNAGGGFVSRQQKSHGKKKAGRLYRVRERAQHTVFSSVFLARPIRTLLTYLPTGLLNAVLPLHTHTHGKISFPPHSRSRFSLCLSFLGASIRAGAK